MAYRGIPSLNWLRVFEVAAQTESFASAARVLNMSPSAVSQQIGALEQHFAGGLVTDGIIACPLHLGQFDIGTGAALAGPVCVELQTCEVEIENGWVAIRIPG